VPGESDPPLHDAARPSRSDLAAHRRPNGHASPKHGINGGFFFDGGSRGEMQVPQFSRYL